MLSEGPESRCFFHVEATTEIIPLGGFVTAVKENSTTETVDVL